MKPLLTLISLFAFIVCLAQSANAQIGTIKTEEYKASFEKTQSIDSVSNYIDTIKVPIQLLKIQKIILNFAESIVVKFQKTVICRSLFFLIRTN